MPPSRKAAQPVTVEAVAGRAEMRRFLEVPWTIYADDPNWVPPLIFERLQHLDPAKNPYFDRAEAAFWTARRGETLVGRISAQVNRAHLEAHDDATGHFGFLEAADDEAVFEALLSAAEGWLHDRDMTRVVGPFSLSINDESGLLIDGFDTPPYLLMGHNPPYYPRRLEAQGYRKVKDLIAYSFDLTRDPPAIAVAALEKLKRNPDLRLRPLDMAHFEADMATIVDIFNDAWSNNWGYVPMSPEEVRFMGENLKPLVKPGFICIAELKGEPVAMAVTLPNVNEAIADLDGRLLPFGWAKLLWRLKVKGLKSARMPLMGVRRHLHGTPLGFALALAVIETTRRSHLQYGTTLSELSWVLEDNRPVRRAIELPGGQPYKTYRLYEKGLS
jgi:hypothetical protein